MIIGINDLFECGDCEREFKKGDIATGFEDAIGNERTVVCEECAEVRRAAE